MDEANLFSWFTELLKYSPIVAILCAGVWFLFRFAREQVLTNITILENQIKDLKERIDKKDILLEKTSESLLTYAQVSQEVAKVVENLNIESRQHTKSNSESIGKLVDKLRDFEINVTTVLIELKQSFNNGR